MKHPMQLVRDFEGRAKKRFGQHFLISEGIIDRICGDSSLDALNRVVEIGPGLGVLTQRLVEAVEQVVAVELDPDMVDFIQHRFGDRPGFQLHHLDAGKVTDWARYWVMRAGVWSPTFPQCGDENRDDDAPRAWDLFSLSVMLQKGWPSECWLLRAVGNGVPYQSFARQGRKSVE